MIDAQCHITFIILILIIIIIFIMSDVDITKLKRQVKNVVRTAERAGEVESGMLTMKIAKQRIGE